MLLFSNFESPLVRLWVNTFLNTFLCWSDELSAHPYEEPSYGVYALADF